MTSTRLAFDDDLLSDLTLKYHDETVRVHKVMLYRTSAWFRRKFELHANDEVISVLRHHANPLTN